MELTKDIILANPALAELAGPEIDAAQPGVPYPLGRDNDIAAIMAAETDSVVGQLSRAQLIKWATTTGQRTHIKRHADNLDSPLNSIALTLQDILSGPLDGVDLGDTDNQTMLDAWLTGTVADGDMRATLKADLLARATHTELRYPGVNGATVAYALGRSYRLGV